LLKKINVGRVWWLQPVIPTTWEAEISTQFKGSPGEKFMTPSKPTAGGSKSQANQGKNLSGSHLSRRN
jgi:hypothetical protein